MGRAQDSNLAHLLADWSQSENFFEIKPPLTILGFTSSVPFAYSSVVEMVGFV